MHFKTIYFWWNRDFKLTYRVSLNIAFFQGIKLYSRRLVPTVLLLDFHWPLCQCVYTKRDGRLITDITDRVQKDQNILRKNPQYFMNTLYVVKLLFERLE